MSEPTSEQSVFLEAIALASPAERAAYLDEACRDKPKLRAELDALLAAHDRLGGALPPTGADHSIGAAIASESPFALSPPEASGAIIGRYKLLQEIGEGGMGTVWMAQQTEPVKRVVALKLIKAGMDSKQVLARFEAERQALALMDHANIARVLDAGTTSTGRPYFVMDLVKGVPITKYCDEHHFTPRQRLELFIPVCQAVQHAHQKGIIHRDLKPSNVLVAPYDGKPIVKVIDFGVAKAAGQQLTDRTLVTGFGAVVGTLEYMSPEQAELNNNDIDTRSDIYALGVLLYELLTGSTPFTRKELETAGMVEMLRVIREQEPSKPSTKLSSSEALPTLSANRGTEPAKLTRLVRGELDWIVMKALEKDRNRRYETANGFAMDVQRYLTDEPVQACPPSVGYRLRKFARRNRVPLITAGFVFAAIILGTAGSIWQAVRATQAEGLAESRFEAEKTARNQAQVSLEEARRAERDKSRQLAIAHVREAQALRHAGLAGRRFDSLEALKNAAGHFRALGELDQKRALELRNEAVACLTIADLRPGKAWSPDPGYSAPLAFDSTLQRYVVQRPSGKGRVNQGHLSVCRASDRQEIADFPGFGAPATAAKFSPDGRYLAVHYHRVQRDNYVWDLRSRKAILKVSQGNHPAFPSFSPDSRLIALFQRDRSVRIYDLSSGATRDLAAGPPGSPECFYSTCFHPDGRQLAVVVGGTVQLREVDGGKVVAAFKHPSTVYVVAWRSDGKLFATGCWDNDIYLWDVASPAQPVRVLKGHFGSVVDVRFSHAGDLLFSNSWDSTDRLWDPMTGQQLVSRPGGVFRDHQFGPDDQGLDDGWQVATGRERRTFHGRKVPVWAAVCPRGPLAGRLMATVSRDGAQLWDLAAAREGDKLLGTLPVGESLAAHFDPNGEGLITDSKRMGLQRWPITPAPQTGSLQIGPPESVGLSARAPYIGADPDFALSADGHIVAHCPHPGQVLLHYPGGSRPRVLIESPRLRHMSFSPNGRWLALGNWQGRGAKVWDAQTGELVHDLDIGEQGEKGAWPAFSPDGKWLVIGTFADYRVWEVGAWRQKHVIPREMAGSSHGRVVLSPDGRMLAALHKVSEVRLVDPATGREFARLPSAGPPYCFSPDSSQLVTYAGREGAMHVWDLRLIRRQLAEIGLDWDLPPCPPCPPPPSETAKPLRLQALAAVRPAPSKKLDARAYFDRGLLYMQLRQHDKAMGELTRAIELDPDEAIVACRKAIELDPKNVVGHIGLGHALYAQKKLDEAASAYQEALRLRPDLALAQESLNNVAWSFVACADSNPKRAAELVKRLLALNPNPELLTRCAPMLLLANDTAAYRQLCARVIGSLGDADQPRTAYLVARICALAPDAAPDAAKLVQTAERAVRSKPLPHYLHTLGLAHYRAGQFEKAIKRLQASIEGGWTANATNWLALAMAHQRLGHADEARNWFDKAVRWIDSPGGETRGNSVGGLRSLDRHDSLACMVLRYEAEALLGLRPQPATKGKQPPGEKR